MSSNKRKSKKYRGSKTHGAGSMKKRRGAGSRGGRGNSGRGKRADQKKPSIWKRGSKQPYLGNYGFTSVHPDLEAINVSDIEKQLVSLLDDGVASQKDDVITINLSDIGVDKLLGAGQVTKQFDITVKQASKGAISKVEEAGGSVTLTEESSDSEE